MLNKTQTLFKAANSNNIQNSNKECNIRRGENQELDKNNLLKPGISQYRRSDDQEAEIEKSWEY